MTSNGWTISDTDEATTVGTQGHAQPSAARLSNLFTDLIAYVLYFQATAAEHNLPAAEVRAKITALIDAQEKRARAEGFVFDRYLDARYAVLSWVDEAILNSKWIHRTQWQHLMLHYYETMNAGEGFFQKLESLPPETGDVKEVYYLCLSLGFQGKYAFGDGPKQIAELRNTLYRQLPVASKGLESIDQYLFPEAYQEARVRPQKKPRPIGFLWYGLAFLLPVLLFVIYWVLLGQQVEEKTAWLDANPLTQEAPEPPKVAWQLALIKDANRLGVDARSKGKGVVVILPGLFSASDSSLSESERLHIEEIALAFSREAPNRRVLVEGHSSPEGTDEINDRLSRARARAVAEFLERQGIKNVQWQGRGSRIPFENPQQSRRVEIFIDEGS